MATIFYVVAIVTFVAFVNVLFTFYGIKIARRLYKSIKEFGAVSDKHDIHVFKVTLKTAILSATCFSLIIVGIALGILSEKFPLTIWASTSIVCEMVYQAIIEAEGKIISRPCPATPLQCCLLLLAVYYVFDVKEPPAYASFLTLMQKELLHQQISGKQPTSFDKIVRLIRQIRAN